MRRTSVVAASLSLLVGSAGCLSVFPPSSFDYGRGARPLEPGTLRVQAGGGAGVAPVFLAAGAAAGGRAEVQVTDHLAVAVDGGAGVQLMPFVLVAPFAGHASAQLNPGLDWLAVRGSVGAGVDVAAVALVPELAPFPWISAAGSLVVGVPSALFDTGDFEPYLSLNLGTRRYLRVADGLPGIGGQTGTFQLVYASGATVGGAWHLSDVMSLYGAGNATIVIAEGSSDSAFVNTGFSPVGSVQGGVAFHF